MKTAIFSVVFCFFLQNCAAQQATNLNYSAFANFSEWQPVEDWCEAFHAVFGEAASENWMSELAAEGKFYRHFQTGGLAVVLPGYMHSEARLQAKLEFGFCKVENTHLLPLVDALRRDRGNVHAKFLGILEGVPASLDLAVTSRDGSYLTVMGFSPCHELNNEFSVKFQQFAHRAFSRSAWAVR